MMFDAKCPSCDAVNKTPLHYEGISIKCMTCSAKFVAVDPKDYLFKFHCSSCGGRIEAKEKLRGSLAACPHCEDVVRVGDYTSRTKPLSEPLVDPEAADAEMPFTQVKDSEEEGALKRTVRKVFRL